ncbi:MAG: hypothetical protein NXH97_08410 [Rhodobacteraceae bacterium]|nr:hypothetical protein [Paracoccaceae bacterium]
MFDLQAWLDHAVDSLIAGDEEAFVDMLSLPFSVITGSGTMIALAEEDLREAFRSYVSSIHEQGVTDLVRVAKQTTMIEPVLAVGVYETHILRRGHRIIEPYSSSVNLRREGEVWRATSMMNAVSHNDWMTRIPGNTPDVDAGLKDGTGG